MQFAEARPDDRAHVHHMILYVREPGSHWLRGEPAGVFFVAPKVTDDNTDSSALPSDFLVGYAPGQPPEILEPGKGKLVKAGSDFVMEIHYTTNGKASTDRSKFGLVFARQSRKRASSRSPPPTENSRFRPAIPTIAWTPNSKSAPP